MKFIVGAAIILSGMGLLAWMGVQEAKSYSVSIRQLHTMGDEAYTKHLRVGGLVQPGSIKQTGTHAEFVLVEGDQTLAVSYKGSEPPPDTFKDNSQALAIGEYGRDGVFHAKELQAKCASKYAPQQGAAAPAPAKGY